MNLNKLNLEVVRAASKDASRYNLNALHITPNYTEATNGHILARMTYPVQFEPGDVPEVIKTGKKEDIIPFMVPIDALKGIKFPKKVSLPMLADLYIDVEATNGNGNAKFGMTDLQTTTQPEIRKIDGEYPDTEACVPKGEPVFEISLDGRYLATLAEMASGLNIRTGGITLRFYGFNSPAVMTAHNEEQEFYGLIMPMNGDAKDLTKKEEATEPETI